MPNGLGAFIGRSITSRVGGFFARGGFSRLAGAFTPFGRQQTRQLVGRAGQRLLPAFTGGGLTAAGSRLGRLARFGGGAIATGAGFALGESLIDGDGAMRKKHRRINPLNGRAASRAIRRITLVRGMLKRIERQMPKRKCSCATRRRAKC